ncbi:cytochrome P450 82C4-like [Papaver somniferum]|uniref:cytochrome P450 82C4-like n=1 Tax=Papaver somniferum TaxID=3469 RepID=UPI000E6F7C76|nr:cytochrome P450 82C4-like [Papaver somniferum]
MEYSIIDTLLGYQQFSITNYVVTSLFAFALYYLLVWGPSTKSSLKMKNQAPEPAGSLPFIGHHHLMNRSSPQHVALGAMADKYGPVFTVLIGVRRTLVVSSWEAAKECFTTNDKVFVSRPRQAAGKYIGYDNAMLSFASDGKYWNGIRKIMKTELLSNNRLALVRNGWESETATAIKKLYHANWGVSRIQGAQRAPVLVEMKQWIGDLTLNLSSMMIAGKRCFGDATDQEAEKCQKGLRDFVKVLGLITLGDMIPFLAWLDLDGREREIKSAGKDLDLILNTINKATYLGLLQGGSVWTMFTVLWAVALLVNHPHVLKKAHDELDSHVGKERQVDESDIKNLNYIQAIVKEAMRLYPVSMRLLESEEDCTVAGYYVPAGTRLIVNTWKIQRDPRVWSDPSGFRPERFLTSPHKDIDVKGRHFKLTPFGSGRRSCPRTSMGIQMVNMIIARLAHGFDFKTPSNAPVDMTEAVGFANMVKATPLEVVLTPRLPKELYA